MGFWDDLTGQTGADAARGAASDTYNKQYRAITALNQYGDEYAKKYADLSKGYDPYVSAGGSALERLMAGMGFGGGGEQFTQAYRALPGYQAGLETGRDALTSSAAARGGTQNAATLKALTKYGSDYEDRRVGDYLSRLMALSSTGQQATGQQIGTVGTGLQGQLGTRNAAYGGSMQSAGTVGQGMVAGANAEAAGAQNILNTGVKLAGMAMGVPGGGFSGSAFGGTSTGASPLGSLMSPSGSNPFNSNGTRNTMAYGWG